MSDSSGKNRAVDNGSILKLNAVSKTFEKSNVCSLQEINLEVEQHEFLCLLGPNGCGKTTLLNIIAGFPPYFPHTKGEIYLDGQVIDGPGSDRVMVFQEDSLFPWLTVQDNIEFGLRIRGVPKLERHEISEHYLNLMGVEDFRSKHPYELSGGMKQKTELARAFALNPKILLLDEPFARVDALTRYSLEEELLRVSGLEKTTVIFVTHSVQEAVFLGDRICLMTKRPGKILEEVRIDLPKRGKLADTVGNKKFPKLISHLLGVAREEGFGSNMAHNPIE